MIFEDLFFLFLLEVFFFVVIVGIYEFFWVFMSFFGFVRLFLLCLIRGERENLLLLCVCDGVDLCFEVVRWFLVFGLICINWLGILKVNMVFCLISGEDLCCCWCWLLIVNELLDNFVLELLFFIDIDIFVDFLLWYLLCNLFIGRVLNCELLWGLFLDCLDVWIFLLFFLLMLW